jgi:hypothetical protein
MATCPNLTLLQMGPFGPANALPFTVSNTLLSNKDRGGTFFMTPSQLSSMLMQPKARDECQRLQVQP